MMYFRCVRFLSVLCLILKLHPGLAFSLEVPSHKSTRGQKGNNVALNSRAHNDEREKGLYSASSDSNELATRRALFTKITAAAIPTAQTVFPTRALAVVADTNVNSTVTAPLEFIPALNAYVVQFTMFGERFGAVLDTGSPFLTVPSTCSKWSYKYRWGCYHPELTMDSGYSNTVEGFDNNYGTVVWRKAGFALEQEPSQDLVFGVVGPALMDGSGGVFFGLIKETDKWIRPSFLGQTGYQSFCVDLRPSGPNLVLSKSPLIESNADYIPLVRDLNRRYGAPVVHYTAKASGFVVNGLPLRLSDKTPTYVIFDTGVSGMAVSQELYDGRYLQARKNREKSLWGQVTVSFATKEGQQVQLEATKPVTTPLGEAALWRRFKGNLIVLGLAFLDGKAMTIDTVNGRLQFDD